jgi:UDP-N-acetylmuramyl pentapeptide phosphotransferase/UDP-N-acetylglucosamine-1-phosphate transferase
MPYRAGPRKAIAGIPGSSVREGIAQIGIIALLDISRAQGLGLAAKILKKMRLPAIGAILYVAVVGITTILYERVVRPRGVVNAPEGVTFEFLLVGFVILALTAGTAALAGFLILRYEALHARWSHDVATGPQKFHTKPTPRIGGLGIMSSLLISVVALLLPQEAPADPFGYLVLSSLPAFLGGIAEDITKSVIVPLRLALTMLAAAIGVWLLGAIIPRLDIVGFDALLSWVPFGIAFTMFAVGGVANAINIIDGYNGLAAGHAVIVLVAIACVSALVGDAFLFTAALAMIGSLLGFLYWNYPGGKIFLGDGGAYLVGFWLAELSVLLVARHPEVSPWFPLLLLVYPIFETLFSIYRRKILHGVSPGQPDRQHLHQMIYLRLASTDDDSLEDEPIQLNNRVAPYGWLMTFFCAIVAMAFWRETRWLVAGALLFCTGYVLFYRRLVKSRTP